MNRIVHIVPPVRAFPSERLADAARDALVREMADHLVAAVHGGLDTSCDQDVIAYLYNAPQRYHHRLILDHMDSALYLAKQTLVAVEMSNGRTRRCVRLRCRVRRTHCCRLDFRSRAAPRYSFGPGRSRETRTAGVLMADAVERYIIRSGSEWAYIYIDETNGVFTSYSSFGNYAYQWRSIGSATLKEFLSDLDFSYFMGKTRNGYMRFDLDASIDGIKRTIIERRRDGALTSEEARSAWNDLPSVDATNADSFFNEFCSSTGLMEVYGGDYCDIARERPDGDSRGFWREIWPEFLKQIAAPAEVAA